VRCRNPHAGSDLLLYARRSCSSASSTCSWSGYSAGWCSWRAVMPRRTRSSPCCGRRSRCCAARSRAPRRAPWQPIRDGQAVVTLRGELNLADTPCVASHLIAAVAACGPSVIVDLAGLECIAYSGLSVLRGRKWTRRNGGDLSLAAPQQPVRQILEATGLIDVFAVYHSVEEAANSARQAQPRSTAVPQPLHAATVTRSGVRLSVCRIARHPLVRPLPGRETCRPRHMARYRCAKWCSSGGT
jgi:anti-sigma B factor antagonist